MKNGFIIMIASAIISILSVFNWMTGAEVPMLELDLKRVISAESEDGRETVNNITETEPATETAAHVEQTPAETAPAPETTAVKETEAVPETSAAHVEATASVEPVSVPTTEAVTEAQTAAPTAAQTEAPTEAPIEPATEAVTEPAVVTAPTEAIPAAAPILERAAGYSGEIATNVGEAKFDVSHVNEGWVGVSVKSDVRIKIQVIHGDIKKNYDTVADGTPFTINLADGNGEYRIRVMKNTEGVKYVQMTDVRVNAQLTNEFTPFLVSDSYVNWSAANVCVQKAAQLRPGTGSDAELVGRIVDYLKQFPYEIREVPSTYVPNPDTLINNGKGFCMEYAFTLAAMCRSQGIPTKVIYGDVSGSYHAWNEVYVPTGGTYYGITLNAGWNMIDVTYLAYGRSQAEANAVPRVPKTVR